MASAILRIMDRIHWRANTAKTIRARATGAEDLPAMTQVARPAATPAARNGQPGAECADPENSKRVHTPIAKANQRAGKNRMPARTLSQMGARRRQTLSII